MKATGKPLTGTILGAIAGIFLVVIIQQAGIWPLDRMLTFGAMGIMALIGFVLTKGGAGGTVAKIIAMIIIVVFVAVGALGATEAGQAGYLDGGCTVTAFSDVDAIPGPEATSKSAPFDLIPTGFLSWDGTTPGPIENHHWEIWVDVAGFPYLAAAGGSPNDGKSQQESGDVDLLPYAEDVEAILGTSDIGGIYEVGGFIDGDGGYCEGLGFVRFPSSLLQGPIALGALVVLVVILIIILLVGRSVRRVMITTSNGAAPPPDLPGGGQADMEIFPDGFESGDTSSWGDSK